MIDYIIASASIPALLKSQEIDGKKFIDGGVYSNNPVPLLAEHGIKNIIEVDISGIGVSRKYNKEKLGLQCLYTIRNSVDIIGTLEFNKVKILEGIDIGYYDTMKAFGEISGAKYYIENKESEYLYPLSDDELIFVLDKLHSDLEFSFKNQRQNLIKTLEEYSTGKINTCSILGICLEISAELFDISKKKLYTFDSLLNELMQKYESIKELYTKKDINEIMETLKKRKWKEISGINLVVALLFLQEDDMLDPTFLLNFFRKAYISYIFLTIVKKRLSSL